MMTPPFLMLARIEATGRIDDESATWLVHGICRWMREGGKADRLAGYLRLPPTRAKLAIAARDYWLCLAADELPDRDRAAALRLAVDAFLRRNWPAWRSQPNPPTGTSPFDAALFYAAKSGAQMRLTRRQFGYILSAK